MISLAFTQLKVASTHATTVMNSIVDRDTGREWVERELSKDEYSATDLTPLEQLGQWLSNMWDDIVSGALRGNSPWLILLVVVALAAIIALIIWRVRLVGLKRTSVPLSAFDPVVATPEPGPWRDSARIAAENGDMRTAVIDSARAIFAVLSQKQIVSLDSASTASELSRTAGEELPEHRQVLTRVAHVFNDLVFGEAYKGDTSIGAPSHSGAGVPSHSGAGVPSHSGAGVAGLSGAGMAGASTTDLRATYAELLGLDERLSALAPRHRSAVAS